MFCYVMLCGSGGAVDMGLSGLWDGCGRSELVRCGAWPHHARLGYVRLCSAMRMLDGAATPRGPVG